MSITQRPINIIDDGGILAIPTENNIDLSFNYTYPVYSKRTFNIQYKDEANTIGTAGLEIQLKNIHKDKNQNVAVTVNSNTYYPSRMILSVGMDQFIKGRGAQPEYSFVIAHEPINTTTNLYIVLPIIAVEDATQSNQPNLQLLTTSIADEIEDGNLTMSNTVELTDIDLNLNTLISSMTSGNPYYYYYMNNDLFIVFLYTEIRVYLDGIIDAGNFMPNVETFTASPIYIYQSNGTLHNFQKSSTFMDDIYIDCSPEGDTNTQIIKPRNVFAIRPLVNPDSLGSNSTLFLIVFLSIVICGIAYKSTGRLIGMVNAMAKFTKDITSENGKEYMAEQGEMIRTKARNNGGLLGLIGNNGYIIFILMAIVNVIFASLFIAQDTTFKQNTILSSSENVSGTFAGIFGFIYVLHYILLKKKYINWTPVFLVPILICCIILLASWFLGLFLVDSNITTENWAIFSLMITPALSCLYALTNAMKEQENGEENQPNNVI
uniref:Uncharacterized protein n=1 Tax=viral metagenome TaxID=1070528 RepID=A0A6C0KJ14_9ZZZZ